MWPVSRSGAPSSVRMVSNVMNVDAISVCVMKMLNAAVMINVQLPLQIVSPLVPMVNVLPSVVSDAK